MKYVISLLIILTVNVTAFCQDGTTKKPEPTSVVKTRHLDALMRDKETLKVTNDKVEAQAYRIDTLTSKNKDMRGIINAKDAALEQCDIQSTNNANLAANFEKLWKSDRAKKRRKGWANALLIGALGGLGYLYIIK